MRLIICLLALLTTLLQAQEVIVINSRQLDVPDNMEFYYPVFGKDDGSLLLTTDNYKGIWKFDLSDNSLVQLNDYDGAGYKPVVSDDGTTITFRNDEFVKGRRYTSLMQQNIETRDVETLLEKQRNLSSVIKTSNGKIKFILDKKVTSTEIQTLSDKAASENRIVNIENSDLVLYMNDNRIVLNPLGDGNYIWPSLSPDGKKILFTKAGDGTYVCDLNGNIISELGYANYPSWSSDGKWIVYMKDYDDGYVVTSSNIFVAASDGSKSFQVTDTESIHEMYPAWSSDNKKIVCNTADGKIFLFELSFN